MRPAATLLVLLSLLCACASRDPSGSRPGGAGTDDEGVVPAGMSGLAHYRDALFVVVHDAKRRDPRAPRLAIVAAGDGDRTAYRPLDPDWEAAGGPSHDLEAVCPLPETRSEYLAVESGHRGSRGGRIFLLRLTGGSFEEVRADLAGTLELPDVENVEGAFLFPRHEGPPLLALCERNERKGEDGPEGAQRFARLLWYTFDREGARIEEVGRSRIVADEWPGTRKLRTCAGLYLEGDTLWLAATVDDDGRFDSMVYEVPIAEPLTDLTARVRWRVPGKKVEGLGPSVPPGRGLTIVTDEDDLGGSVRLLSRTDG